MEGFSHPGAQVQPLTLTPQMWQVFHDQDRKMTPHHEKRGAQDAEIILMSIQKSECLGAVSGPQNYIRNHTQDPQVAQV